MSLESVRAFFAEQAPDIALLELATSTATVALAAALVKTALVDIRSGTV